MKIFYLGFFFLTFLIGCVFFLTFAEIPQFPIKTDDKFHVVESIPLSLSNETKFEPEIFDIVDDWEEEIKFKTRLLETGDYYGEDIKANSGEKWLGLFNENGKTSLRFTKIEVKRTDEYIPGGKKPIHEIRKTVTVSDKNQPLFLLKNAKKLSIGEVKTLYRQPSDEELEKQEIETLSLVKGFVQEFQLGDKTYTFRVKEGLTKSNEKSLALILETEQTSQIIHTINYSEPGDWVGSLLWVGDLDRDSKLDLYMEFYNYEKGSYSTGLFLSSEAENGKLLKKVAVFSTLGC